MSVHVWRRHYIYLLRLQYVGEEMDRIETGIVQHTDNLTDAEINTLKA